MENSYRTLIKNGLGAFACLGLCCLISACTTITPPTHACAKPSENTLLLQGSVDEDMAACAQAKLDNSIDIIQVSSFGGDTGIGREIGDLIAQKPRTLIVLDACLSSCANYFVPTAARVILRRDAIIGLHGTPDPKLMVRSQAAMEEKWRKELAKGRLSSEEIETRRQQQIAWSADELTDENRFARAYSVPLGWRLYRQAQDSNTAYFQYFSGEAGARADPRQARMIVPQRDMLVSCLPHVTFEGLEHLDSLPPKGTKQRRKLNALKVQLSGTWACKPGTGQGER